MKNFGKDLPQSFLLMLLACFFVPASVFADSGIEVYARYAPRTAKIFVVGTLYDGRIELAGEGSGFLVGDKTILTAAHIIPNMENYKEIDISVMLETLEGEKISAEVESVDPRADIAILELSDVAPGRYCPVLFSADGFPGYVNQPGSEVFVLGFPLDKGLSISRGVLSNTTDRSKEWQTDLTLNPGNSGGPIFSSSGRLMGIAVRRTRAWRTSSGEEIDVDGVSFFVPTERIHSSVSLVFPNSDSKQCWEWQLPGGGGGGTGVKPPSNISNVQLISRTKDDHPDIFPHSRDYTEVYSALDNYQITNCDLEYISVNNASDILCNIEPDGRRARLQFKLTSGPLFDRWRGWLHARVSLTQSRND